MNPIIILKSTLNNLAKNRLRSFITLLSIVLGIAIIVAMYNIGLGIKEGVRDLFANFSQNIIFITEGTFKGYYERKQKITLSDIAAIQNICPEIIAVLPYADMGRMIKYRDLNERVHIMCVTENYFYLTNQNLEGGSFFGISDSISRASVCLLGYNTAKKFFKSQNPVGKTIGIDNAPFEVIGVFDHVENDNSPITRGGTDDTVFIPLSTAMSKFRINKRIDEVDNVALFLMPQANSGEVISKTKKILRERYHISPDKPDEFNVETLDQYTEFWSSWTKRFTGLLNSIAVIALFISGINIMNIMLASVKQRTREIGVRMSVGARARDIILQFLAEAVIICLIGGFIGTILSFPLSVGLAKLLKEPVKFSYGIITVSFSYSLFLGLIFGIYPAYKAASIEPIEALRYE